MKKNFLPKNFQPPKSPRKQRSNPEANTQIGICTLLSLLQLPHFFIPNGTYVKSWKTRKMLKDMGLKPGVPDLFVTRPFYGNREVGTLGIRSVRMYCGLFIECKSKTGKPSPAQLKKHAELLAEGYDVVVCNTVDSAQFEITKRYAPNQHQLLKSYNNKINT